MRKQLLKDERELLSKPGDTIIETLEHYKMSQAELAERLGKTPPKINDLINGKEPITYNTALQLEKVLGIDAQFWLNREMHYREKLARIEQEEQLETYIDWLLLHPVKELKKCGYLKAERAGPKMAEELLHFYGVASPSQWQNMYVNHYGSASFRKSEAHQTAIGSMAAWLRMGELEMRKLPLPEYNKEKFKDVLSAVKAMVVDHPEDFAKQLQSLCATAGVGVVYTVCLPKTPVSGAARWIGGNPLIQLTDRHKTNDHFWFTFFHEAGHVILHGKKDVFLEGFEGFALEKEKETEADHFARKWLLPEKFINELPEKIGEEEIEAIADKYGTHPAIVVGRLQHMGYVPYSFGNKFKVKIGLFGK